MPIRPFSKAQALLCRSDLTSILRAIPWYKRRFFIPAFERIHAFLSVAAAAAPLDPKS